MMIVVQRRADGLYYMNNTGNYSRREHWTNDLSEVKPFRGLRGALSSFAPTSFYWGPGWSETPSTPSTFVDSCCSKVKTSWRGVTNKCEHYKAKQEASKQAFREKYKLVEVAITPIREVPYE